ncbi:hypothetical protein FOZ63_023227 [Perkinsus olseni]|uniref:PEHE domain-containing protein n=1 Tax=Perkinsus olseni TaxID=32597 RepID=A0A7J6PSC1_PEROL|nr:hypothetical protein FOZ63_023227 [Perkinsus olseni]
MPDSGSPRAFDHRPSASDNMIPSLPIKKREGRKSSRAHSTRAFSPSLDTTLLQKYATPRERTGSTTPLTTARSAGFTTPRSYRDKRRYTDRKERAISTSSKPSLVIEEDMEKKLRRIRDNRLSLDEIISHRVVMHPGTSPDASRSSSSRQGSQPSSGALASFSSEDIRALKRAEESVWLQQEQRRIRWLQRLKEKISDEEEREFECVQKAKRARLSGSKIPRTGPTTHRNEKSWVNRLRPRTRNEESRLDSERESTEIKILPEAYCGSDDDIASDGDSSDDEALGDKDDNRNDGAGIHSPGHPTTAEYPQVLEQSLPVAFIRVPPKPL